ncbi:CdaR family transcriptional regulator [Streptomyces sp. Ru72]|uniref:PucR family transcriptional regulator n=1 Tax=Streptomyces sp. Ru72 TaxID=2080747 RepID=UPI000CDDD4E2|nr:helix-turn-helix domain-containing protein [Streptomyces sp. Ru72]POX43165.1 PucR family transcriptional regulator [Streptomyces sp. Ru72]
MDVRTLGDLLDVVGEPSLRLRTAPAGLTAPVTEALLHDAHAPLPRTPGALLLAVGVAPRDAGPLVRAAAEAGMTGVVVRGEDGPVAEAEAAGIALLCVDGDAAWHQVHLLLASALAARPAAGGGGDTRGELFALADAVAAAVGGATAIEDPGQRILAYSTVPGQATDEDRRQGILGLRVPEIPDNAEQYRTVLAAPGPVRLPALAGALPRLAVAVRAGGETLGSLWVVDDGRLAPDAEEALARGASTAALLLLRARAARELARHQDGALLRRVLDGTADPAAAAHRLGLQAVRVAAFVLDSDSTASAPSAPSAPDDEQTTLRLLDLVRLQCEARYGRHACVLVDGVVYALLPASGERGGARHVRLAEDIVRRAGRALRVPVRAGLGEVVPSLAEAAASRRDADLVLRVLGPEQPVASARQVRARITLLRLAEVMRGRRELAAGAWEQVVAHDVGHGTEYAATLLAWLEAGCDVGGAAERLAVHPNTCRYRLRQVRRQLGVDLDDADERLALWLQLRVLNS